MLDEFSLSIKKPTVVVLDNAKIHTARKVKERFKIWQNRGLYIFYLPPYSPHLNIIERLWKEMKQGWIRPQDYLSADDLFYAVDRICAAIGKLLFINFSKYAFQLYLILNKYLLGEIDNIKGTYPFGKGSKDEKNYNYKLSVQYDPLVLNAFHFIIEVISDENGNWEKISRGSKKKYIRTLATEIRAKLINESKVYKLMKV